MTTRAAIDHKALLIYLRRNCYGLINAKNGSASKLIAHFGLNDKKRIREAVNALRQAEVLIGSSPQGYFIPLSLREAQLAKSFIERSASMKNESLRLALEGYCWAMDREFGRQEQFDLQEVAS